MSRRLTNLFIQLLWLLAACESGGLASHRVQVPAKLVFSVQPTASIVGAAIRPAVVVTVLDAHGNTVTRSNTRVTVTLGSSPPDGTLSGTASVAAVDGVATFSNLSLDKSGKGYTLNANATGLGGATSSPFNVTYAPSMLSFEVQPSTTGSGQLITPAVQVAVQDLERDTVENASASVTVGIGTNPSGGTLAGTTTVAVVNGVATFSTLSIDNPGTGYTLTASSVGLNSAGSAAFNVGSTFDSVSAGSYHTCGVTGSSPGLREGAAYCWGLDSTDDVLADDVLYTGGNRPVAVAGGLILAGASAGRDHTCAVTTSGAAYCWGAAKGSRGLSGLLGSGSNAPVEVAGAITLAVLSAGGGHTCAVTPAGAAYCWGGNDFGQLGDGSATASSTPVPVAGGLTFATVRAGYRHTCAVTTFGAAYCWGWNGFGQLGDGSTTDRSTPVPVAEGLMFAALSAGGGHTCAVTTSGAAYCWGYNGNGQLGNGLPPEQQPGSSRPVAVAGRLTFATVSAGGSHTCGMHLGIPYCWGWNGFGQLGDGRSYIDSSTPVRIDDPLTH
jgi:alpha-tubulin suppressor-like RCC1 family protein